MSTYQATIGLGPYGVMPTHSWTIDSGDPAVEADTSQVLDQLNVSWSIPESAPYPAQPDMVTGRLRLLLDNLSDISDVSTGDIANIRVTSGGTLVVQFTGRIGQMTATPVRRKNLAGVTVRKMLVDMPIVDLLADLAGSNGLKITGSWPAETANLRWSHLADAIAAAGGPSVTGGPVPADVQLDALDAAEQPAFDLLDDVLRQTAEVNPASVGYLTRQILRMGVDNDTGSHFVYTDGSTAGGVVPNAPGILVLTAHVLTISFAGALPAAPAGLLIDSGGVEESDISFAALKFNTVTTVKVSGPFGLVSLSNGLPGGEITITTSLTDETDAWALAQMYLPQADDTRWSLDAFTWRPTDAELAGLDYPLIVPSQLTAVVQRSAPLAQVVIAPMPAEVNPGNDSPFYGGTFSAVSVTIVGGDVIVKGRLARRLNGSAGGSAVSWDNLAVFFAAVEWSGGVDNIDPTLSWFELGLAREM